MDSRAVAFWLIPSDPAREFFQRSIVRLAKRFDAPQFIPHVTIFVARESACRAAKILAAVGSREFKLEIVKIRQSADFTKTLFVQFHKDDPLQDLADEIQRRSGAKQRRIVDPHLSLLYQKIDARTRRELAQSFKLPFREVFFSSLCAMLCPSPTRTAEDVRNWEMIPDQNSTTRNGH